MNKRLLFTTLIFIVISFHPSVAGCQERYFTLHVGSYQEKANAVEATGGFISQGMEASFRREEVPGKGNWFRVYVGRFEDSRLANEKGRRMKEAGLITYFRVAEMDETKTVADGRFHLPEHLDSGRLTPYSNIFPR